MASAEKEYSAELPTQVTIACDWKSYRCRQVAARSSGEPKVNGAPCTIPASLRVGASSIQVIGRTKKHRKTPTTITQATRAPTDVTPARLTNGPSRTARP